MLGDAGQPSTRDLLLAARSPDRHRELEESLQPHQASIDLGKNFQCSRSSRDFPA